MFHRNQLQMSSYVRGPHTGTTSSIVAIANLKADERTTPSPTQNKFELRSVVVCYVIIAYLTYLTFVPRVFHNPSFAHWQCHRSLAFYRVSRLSTVLSSILSPETISTVIYRSVLFYSIPNGRPVAIVWRVNTHPSPSQSEDLDR